VKEQNRRALHNTHFVYLPRSQGPPDSRSSVPRRKPGERLIERNVNSKTNQPGMKLNSRPATATQLRSAVEMFEGKSQGVTAGTMAKSGRCSQAIARPPRKTSREAVVVQ